MSTMTPHANVEMKWLTCRIYKGMFSDERAIAYPVDSEKQISVFVPDASIQGQPGEIGKVQVKIARRNGTIFALLPSAEQDVVAVREADLTP
jgi:hypothetical protein